VFVIKPKLVSRLTCIQPFGSNMDHCILVITLDTANWLTTKPSQVRRFKKPMQQQF